MPPKTIGNQPPSANLIVFAAKNAASISTNAAKTGSARTTGQRQSMRATR